MTSDRLWKAVTTRDAQADGLFVYAVTSTRIYCRPSCPSRKPRVDRVEFFPAGTMAEAHGYRACRRCRPDLPLSGSPALARVQRVCAALALAPDARWPVARMAKAGDGSVVQIQRAFRSVLGCSPREYLAACRRRRFIQVLRRGESVTSAVYEAGYGSSSRAYEGLRLPGMTPASYARGGKGAQVDWITTDAPIGRILVAATAKGVCFVEVGENDATLVQQLRQEFPQAEVSQRASPHLAASAAAVKAAAVAMAFPVDLPVDIRGTAFQWRVWRALTMIPRGETRSYSALAREIGAPLSTRAVARACATNPVSLIVPCHRVIGADGGLRGYRWGLGVKARLLEQERSRQED